LPFCGIAGKLNPSAIWFCGELGFATNSYVVILSGVGLLAILPPIKATLGRAGNVTSSLISTISLVIEVAPGMLPAILSPESNLV
jgi:hypothetical protein